MRPMIHTLALTLLAAGSIPSEDAVPREFGDVRWGRKLEPALEQSQKTDRPVLLLFQEVPG